MKAKTLEWLKKNKIIPFNLINKLKDLPEELLNEVGSKYEILSTKNVIIIGNDSIYKDLIAVYLLIDCIDKKSKSIKYFAYPEDDMELGYLTAIMRLEYVKDTYKVGKLSEKLTDMIIKGYRFIISCDSIESLYEIFGESKTKLLVENSFTFKLPEGE